MIINGLDFNIQEYLQGKHLMVFILSMSAIDTQIKDYITNGTPDQREQALALLPLYTNGEWNPAVAIPLQDAIKQWRKDNK